MRKFTLGCTLWLALCFFSLAHAQDGSVDSTFGTKGRTFEPPGNYSPYPRILVQPDGKILHISQVNSSAGAMLQIVRYTADGFIDASFGTNGIRTYPESGFPSYAVLQPDGKILISGSSGGNMAVLRLNPDGTPDTSFDGDGKAVAMVGTGNSAATNLALQPDGKIVVVGNASEGTDPVMAAARFNPDGSPDNTFDGDGKVTVNVNTGVGPNSNKTESAYAVALQLDGRIIIGGSVINYVSTGPGFVYTEDEAVIRLNPDGSRDLTFGNNGLFTNPVYFNEEKVVAVQVQPDGKIVLAIDAARDFEYHYAGIRRLSSNGSSEASVSSQTGGGAVVDLGIQADGRIMVSGWSECQTCPDETGDDFYIIRFLANASATDNTFGTGGVLYIRYNSPRNLGPGNWFTHEVGGSIASQGNKLLIGGYTKLTYYTQSTSGHQITGTETRAALYRLQNSSPLIPENPIYYYQDIDQDGYGNPAQRMISFIKPPVSSENGGDCNDGNSAIHPGAPEVANGVDDNCNGQVDENLSNYTLIPARIEAESFSAMSGVQTENTSDAGGGQNVGYIDYGDWIEYNIEAPSAGSYKLDLRLATPNPNAQFEIYSGSQKIATVNVPQTGGYQTYVTHGIDVMLPAGKQTIRLVSTGGGAWNINWLQFGSSAPSGYVSIPARIEAEAYTAQMGTQNEPTADAGGGQNVGYIHQGDWMEYKISTTGGTFILNARVASIMEGGSFEVRHESGLLLASFSVPNTGGWQNWVTLSTTTTLPAGNHTIRVTSTSTANWNINWLEFLTAPAPPPGYVLIPDKIEAEAYTAQSGTQLEPTSDAGGGQNVGWIDQDDWLEYNISTTGGSFVFVARVASMMNGGSFELRTSTGQVLATLNVPNTGGWQNWTHVSAPVSLPAGNHTLRLVSTSTANWNINWLAFAPSGEHYLLLPARIQAEHYYQQMGVQIEPTSDAGGGYNVGYINQGDWMDYVVHVPEGYSAFTLTARVASAMSGGQFELRNSSGQVLATINVPSTGGWQNWVNVSTEITLPEGTQTLRLVSTSMANWNINWMEFGSSAAAITSTQKAPASITDTERLTARLQLYPNPVQDQLTLHLNNALQGQVKVEVVGMNGAVQRTIILSKTAGSMQRGLSLSPLKKGQYLIRISMNGWMETRKIIKL